MAHNDKDELIARLLDSARMAQYSNDPCVRNSAVVLLALADVVKHNPNSADKLAHHCRVFQAEHCHCV